MSIVPAAKVIIVGLPTGMFEVRLNQQFMDEVKIYSTKDEKLAHAVREAATELLAALTVAGFERRFDND